MSFQAGDSRFARFTSGRSRPRSRSRSSPRSGRHPLVSCSTYSTQHHAAAAIAVAGLPVFAVKGETLTEHWQRRKAVRLARRPHAAAPGQLPRDGVGPCSELRLAGGNERIRGRDTGRCRTAHAGVFSPPPATRTLSSSSSMRVRKDHATVLQYRPLRQLSRLCAI